MLLTDVFINYTENYKWNYTDGQLAKLNVVFAESRNNPSKILNSADRLQPIHCTRTGAYRLRHRQGRYTLVDSHVVQAFQTEPAH